MLFRSGYFISCFHTDILSRPAAKVKPSDGSYLYCIIIYILSIIITKESRMQKKNIQKIKTQKISDRRVKMRQIDLDNMKMSLKDEDNGL